MPFDIPPVLASTALGFYNDWRQVRQQNKLQKLQIRGQKEMIDYGMQKQLDMWHKTGYGPQIEQMEAAGLNPALLYGMGSPGGQTTGSASGNVTGGQASGGMELGQIVAAKKLNAEIDLLEANAELARAEAKKKGGVDTNLADMQAKDLAQGIENKKLQAQLTQAQTTFQQLRNNITAATTDAEIETMQQQAREAYGNASIALTQANLDTNVRAAREETVRAELARIYVDTELKKTQTKLTEKQIEEVTTSIVSMMTKLSQTDRQLDQKDIDITIDKERNQLLDKGIEWGAASNILNGIKDVILRKR